MLPVSCASCNQVVKSEWPSLLQILLSLHNAPNFIKYVWGDLNACTFLEDSSKFKQAFACQDALCKIIHWKHGEGLFWDWDEICFYSQLQDVRPSRKHWRWSPLFLPRLASSSERWASSQEVSSCDLQTGNPALPERQSGEQKTSRWQPDIGLRKSFATQQFSKLVNFPAVDWIRNDGGGRPWQETRHGASKLGSRWLELSQGSSYTSRGRNMPNQWELGHGREQYKGKYEKALHL